MKLSKTCRDLLFTFFVLPAYVGAIPALSQFEKDSELPIEITADSMEWLNKERVAIARGNAVAVQGRYTLSAQVLTAHMAEASAEGSETAAQIRRIEAEGNVMLATPKETARGSRGTYDVGGKTALLVDSVVLTQGENVLRGEKLIMDLITGRTRVEGGGLETEAENGRVRAIFKPSDEDQ